MYIYIYIYIYLYIYIFIYMYTPALGKTLSLAERTPKTSAKFLAKITVHRAASIRAWRMGKMMRVCWTYIRERFWTRSYRSLPRQYYWGRRWPRWSPRHITLPWRPGTHACAAPTPHPPTHVRTCTGPDWWMTVDRGKPPTATNPVRGDRKNYLVTSEKHFRVRFLYLDLKSNTFVIPVHSQLLVPRPAVL